MAASCNFPKNRRCIFVISPRAARNFAKEYVERRSALRNASRRRQRHPEDDLLTPAAAVNPVSLVFFVVVVV